MSRKVKSGQRNPAIHFLLGIESDERTLLESELKEQTDRGAAIVGGAVLEDCLETMLRSVLIDDPKTLNKVFSGPVAALSSFDAKINLARLLGIIDQAAYDDLRHIKDIRNHFAHRTLTPDRGGFAKTGFASDYVKGQCDSLSVSKNIGLIHVAKEYGRDLSLPRERFLFVVVFLCETFSMYSNYLALRPSSDIACDRIWEKLSKQAATTKTQDGA